MELKLQYVHRYKNNTSFVLNNMYMDSAYEVTRGIFTEWLLPFICFASPEAELTSYIL